MKRHAPKVQNVTSKFNTFTVFRQPCAPILFPQVSQSLKPAGRAINTLLHPLGKLMPSGRASPSASSLRSNLSRRQQPPDFTPSSALERTAAVQLSSGDKKPWVQVTLE